jgi:site-specific DNA-methyltransferase (adenine-specific)
MGMKKIDDKSIDMILCDLPYGTTQNKWDIIIPFEPLWKEYTRIIGDGGAVVLFGNQPFTSLLILSNPKWFKYDWIWIKNRATNYLNAKIQPLRAYESILIFYKKQCIFNPIPFEEREYKHRGNNSISESGNYNDHQAIMTTDFKKIKSAKNTIYFNCVHPDSIEYLGHPTQKPVALFEYLIKTYTNENNLILDNCIGSGTTAIACINTNRNYIGFENDPKYFEISNKRIEDKKK